MEFSADKDNNDIIEPENERILTREDRVRIWSAHQNDLYYLNLGDEGEALRESAPNLLYEYFKLLIDYKKGMSEKGKLAIFKIELVPSSGKKMDLIGEETEYKVKISISSRVTPEDQDYSRYIMERILNEDITTLKAFDSGSQTSHNRLKILESYKDDRILLLDSIPETEEVIPDLSDWTIQMEIDALEKLKDRPEHHHLPLLRLAGKNADNYWETPDLEEIRNWKVLKDSPFEGLEEQREMVRKALATKDFAIVEGPPGSGKTTVITEIILQLLLMKKRVLLVGSTHVAVDNVLENLIKYPEIVVPIRIAPMGRELSPEIQGLTYSKYLENFKKRLLSNVHRIQNKTEIQEEWEGIIQSKRNNEFFENILNDSINLVSGTSFGVSKFPEIRINVRNKTFEPLFDVMIIDEASKTTFQEFLVPAMFAKKWIVSGDPKQLSPYSDRGFVEEGIELLIKGACDQTYKQAYIDVEKIVINAYRAIDKIKNSKCNECVIIVLNHDEWNLREDIANQIKSSNYDKIIHTVQEDIEKQNDEILEKIKISGSNIVIIKKDQIERYIDSLPYGASLEDSKQWNALLQYRYNFIYKPKRLRDIRTPSKPKEEKKSLSQEIAWRLIRLYELRDSGTKYIKYREEIKQLIPSKLDRQYIYKRLTDLKCYSLPSILEILMTGNTKYNQSYRETGLESGLPKDYKESIWTRLSYQRRMHHDISLYPRSLVYSSNDGKTVALKDSRMINRDWDYKRYKNRVVWKQIYSKENDNPNKSHKNELEANKIIEELDYFLKFADNNPKRDDTWTVAILSFYKPQTNLLKNKLKDKFNMNGPVFHNKNKSVKISVGNVDSMQGREADLVFLSMVRSGGLGFLDSINRINVALTRARYQLVIVGNKKVFTREKYKDTLIYKFSSAISEDFDIDVRGNKFGK